MVHVKPKGTCDLEEHLVVKENETEKDNGKITAMSGLITSRYDLSERLSSTPLTIDWGGDQNWLIGWFVGRLERAR